MFSWRDGSRPILPGKVSGYFIFGQQKYTGSCTFVLPIPIKFCAVQKPTENADWCMSVK